jgi:hypothetical protein
MTDYPEVPNDGAGYYIGPLPKTNNTKYWRVYPFMIGDFTFKTRICLFVYRLFHKESRTRRAKKCH